jgi:hypothetical protein
LATKLEEIAKLAPPHPKEAFYGWAGVLYRFRRSPAKLRDDLRAAARNVSRGGDRRLGLLIDKTAGDHVTDKMKWKYRVVLEKALKAKVPSRKLRKFIEDLGGINAGSSKSKTVPSKKSGKGVKIGWGKAVKIGWGKAAKTGKTSIPTCCPCIGSMGAGRKQTLPDGQRSGSWRCRALRQDAGATQCVPLSTRPLTLTERPRAVGCALSGMLGVSAVATEGSGNAWKPTAALRVVQGTGQNGERLQRRHRGLCGSAVSGHPKCPSLSIPGCWMSTAGGDARKGAACPHHRFLSPDSS